MRGKATNKEGVLTTTNFWDPHQYKRIVQRVELGATLCDELMRLVEER